MILKKVSIFLFLSILFVSIAFASENTPYAVYHLQRIGDEFRINEIPDFMVLVPVLYEEPFGGGPNAMAEHIMGKYMKTEPKLYKNVKYMPLPEDKDIYDAKNGTTLEFRVSMNSREEFEEVMNELVYSFNWLPSSKVAILVKFEFADKKLEKEIDKKVFWIKDVNLPAFELKSRDED